MSRIHDALRRAEEEIRSRGAGSAAPAESVGAEQEIEILEVLRIEEEMQVAPEDLAGAPVIPLDLPGGDLPAWLNSGNGSATKSPEMPAPQAEPRFEAVTERDQDAEEDKNTPPARPFLAELRPPAEAPPVPHISTARGGASERPLVAPEKRPPLQGPILIESLAAHCRRVEWNANRERMLSFNVRSSNPVGLEEFRTLRSRLYQIRNRQTLSRVLITSALPGEGKTFVASNLAQVIVRQRGRRALLIDCDLRISRLHEVLGAPQAPGVTEYLKGEASEFDIVQKGPLENLFFIPGGRTVSNPADLLAGNRLQQLLDRLAPAFDWVILDTPPAVPIADASILANLCHGVLMVVNSATTPFDLAQKACREFRKAAILGVVLNRVPFMSTYSRYYYEKYPPHEEPKG